MSSPVAVAPDVHVFTSRVMATTTTVIAHGDQALLVDPCWRGDELAAIADWLEAQNLRVVLGWSTHAHHDHVLWHPRFGSGPRLATPRAAAHAATHLRELRRALGPATQADLRELAGELSPLEGTLLPWPGTAVEVLAHDAHSPGHGALWLPQHGVLIAGDMLSDIEIPLLQETGLAAYADGLALLSPYVERADVLVCGHGSVTRIGEADSPAARLAADRAYLAALADGGGNDPRLRAGPGWLREEHERNVRMAAVGGR